MRLLKVIHTFKVLKFTIHVDASSEKMGCFIICTMFYDNKKQKANKKKKKKLALFL